MTDDGDYITYTTTKMGCHPPYERVVCTADINGRKLVKIGLCHPETHETMREYWTEDGKVIANAPHE